MNTTITPDQIAQFGGLTILLVLVLVVVFGLITSDQNFDNHDEDI